MRFGVLGPIQVAEDGIRLSPGGPKQRTVLALLIRRAGEPVSTDALVQGVYGQDAPGGARKSVQTYIYNLRGELGDVITATGSGYSLDAERGDVDALRFEDLVKGATRSSNPETIASDLRAALALWRGHPFADIDGPAELATETARLNELRASALEQRVDADLRLGRHRDLVPELESLTEEYPLREQLRSQQMLALYRSGRQGEALRAYEKTRKYLISEMGLDPSPELRDLQQRILNQDPTLAFEATPAQVWAAILVADIADPQALSTLGPGDRAELLRTQSEALTQATHDHSGDVFAHRGSAIYASFKYVEDAASAARATQQSLAVASQLMRMAIEVGDVQALHDGLVQSSPVTSAAHLIAAAHEGQVLLSGEANRALVDATDAGSTVQSVGRLQVNDEPRLVYQLLIEGLPQEFPPLRTELFPPPLPVEVRGLPGYELREQVGSGAFGVVHRAYQPSVGREVAIKVIRSEYANNPDFIRRFEIDAQLVARLEHPHIVPLHDYWRTPEGAYLVMRWLDGGTLSDRITSGNLTIDETNRLLADIGPALTFAHRRGVVHSHITTSNVLFDEDGGAYLTDFGIASDITLRGAGSVSQDVQALVALLGQCIDGTDDDSVEELLAAPTAGESFADVDSFVAAWEVAMGSESPTSQIVGYTRTRNPFRGLGAFGELDALDFHGRDAEIEEMVRTLAVHPLVVVVGPSGIGKSSVVRAGLIPALRSGAIPGSDQWLITDMFPGSYPYEELASALIRVAREMPTSLEEDLRRDARGLARAVKRYAPQGRTVLLIVDQFEELFTLASEDERAAFLAMLASTIADERSPIRIVVTMRADFFDRPLRFVDLGGALRSGTIPIAAPNDESLRAIVAQPAAGVGVAFEPGLVDRIVADVAHQPGALPLLEFSITELFERRQSDVLTLESYEATGGVLGALGRRAETIYTELDSQGQVAAREAFLRLVNVTEEGRDTRRRVRLVEFERLGLTDAVLRPMLTAFGNDRLLTFDRDPTTRGPTIEVAHEAILSEWPRLTAWIGEHREDLLLRSRLAIAVADWEEANRADTYLFAAGRLSEHEAWTAHTDLTLTTAENDFLESSRRAEDRRTERRRRTRRSVVSGFAAAAVIALLLAATALVARNDARDKAELAAQNQQIAEEQTATAKAEAERANVEAERAAAQVERADQAAVVALAQHAQALITIDPALAVAVAAEAQARSDEPETQRAVFKANSALRGTRLVMEVSGHAGSVLDVAFNHDGSRFATASTDTTVKVWDTSSGDELLSLDGHASVVLGVAFNEDDTRIATASADGTGKVWDAISGEELFTLAGHTNVVVDIAYSDDGTKLATASGDGTVKILEAATGDEYLTLEGHTGPVWAVVFNGNGTRIATASGDGTARVWDAATGDELVTLTGHTDVVLDVAFNDDDMRIATASGDETARVWDAVQGEELLMLASHSDSVRGVAYNGDGSTLVTISNDGTARVWDSATGQGLRTLEGHSSLVRGVAFNHDSTIIATVSNDQTAKLWDAATGDELLTLDGSVDAVRGVAFSADSTMIVTANSDGDATVWGASSGEGAGGFTGHTDSLWEVVFSAAGTMIATASDDGTARVWDTATREELVALIGHGGQIRGVAFNYDATIVATASDDGTAKTWDVATGQELLTLTGHGGPLRGVAFNHDGTRVATASADGTAKIWDAITGEAVLDLAGHTNLVRRVVFSHDGTRVATASADGTAKIWDAITGEDLLTLTGHRGWVLGVDFNHDGTRVATASGDATAKMWDAQIGEVLADLVGHTGPIWDVAFSADGNRLATAGNDGTARIWTTEPGDSCELVRFLVTTKELTDALGGSEPIACTNLRTADGGP